MVSLARPTSVPPPAADTAAAISALRKRFGDRVATAEAIRRQHANTLTWIECQPPDVVVWPISTAEVVDIVRIASDSRLPVVPFGAGTSLEGHVNAPHGGISLDLSRMNAVLDVDARAMDCRVEAGVTRGNLDRYLRDTGLFFPVDPGTEEATLGGMASTRASGTNAVRYGTMRDNVLGLTAVLADGSVVRTGGRARKSAAGYDLTALLVGSEGTLGIITEVALRLYAVPEFRVAAVCPFATLDGACNAVIDAIATGLEPARIELLDAEQIRIVSAYSKLALEAAPTLFVELDGSERAVRESVIRFEELARSHGALRFERASAEADRRRLWKARHDAYWAVRAAFPGKAVLATDVCVPIPRLAECVTETAEDARSSGLVAPILGHVGDGNFHATPAIDPADPAERAALEGFLARLAARAIAMGGTCTGEHGIGQGKIKYLEAEHGHAIEVMRAVKSALDPQGIMNPGKIFLPA